MKYLTNRNTNSCEMNYFVQSGHSKSMKETKTIETRVFYA